MIEGVELLKKTLIFQDTPMGTRIFLLVGAFVLLIVGICLIIYAANEDEEILAWAGGSLSLLGIIFVPGCITMACTSPMPDRYEYVVLVEDQESVVKELYANYEIIDINGNIWTIQDK